MARMIPAVTRISHLPLCSLALGAHYSRCALLKRGTNNSKSWRFEGIHSHLRRDRAAPKMGHPFFCGWLKRTTATTEADPYGMTNKKSNDKCKKNGWNIEFCSSRFFDALSVG
ncbi:MAG TPA: hypothetical protein VNY78_03635 [Edaphobacter sp.]|jgi:hypothetical protein|nr:hypothetical protein [Edaphobacter sp.]